VFITATRAAGKGGGKTVGHKVMGRGSSNPTLGKKPRKKKQPKKWNLLKDAPRKTGGGKR
jgi:hypothetical protein